MQSSGFDAVKGRPLDANARLSMQRGRVRLNSRPMDPQQPSPPPPLPPAPLPYASPQIPPTGLTCPKCGLPAARYVTYTWWGGLLGPKLFNHHKCLACRYTFNGTTGKSNFVPVLIYQIVT